MSRTRVIQLVQHLRPGGLESVALNLAGQSKFEHHIISLDGSHAQALSGWPRLRSVHPAPRFLNKPPQVSFACVMDLRRLLVQLKPLAIHSHHIGPLLYASLAKIGLGIPTHVHTEHDAWHLDDGRARRMQAVLLRLGSVQHVSVGEHVETQIRRYWPTLNTQCINNAVDTQRFAPGDTAARRRELNLPESAWVIACAARLEQVKGVDVLLRAHAQQPADTVLAIGGTGTQADALKQLARELGTHERVHWLGHVDDPALLYQAADVYCQPSRNEGLPLAPIEAQACGIPCVMTSVGASAQISGWPGTWTVPADNPLALAEQLSALYRQDLPSPRTAICERFDLAGMTARYDALYEGQQRT